MERIEAGGIGDPAEVVAVLVEEVERTGERPLRHAVGEDMTESVGAINNTCQEVQGQLLAHFGMV